MLKNKPPLASFFRKPALTDFQIKELLMKARQVFPDIEDFDTEWRFYVDSSRVLTAEEEAILEWILSQHFEPEGFGRKTLLDDTAKPFEVGPKRSQTSPWGTNMMYLCHSVGFDFISRVERMERFLLIMKPSTVLSAGQVQELEGLLYDFMVQEAYHGDISSFDTDTEPEPTVYIPIHERGFEALVQARDDLGGKLSDFQLRRVYDMCVKYGIDPTDVFLFHCEQGISEHSRHPHFNAPHIINGVKKPFTLMEMIKSTVIGNERNSISNFSDNSAVISGFDVNTLIPLDPTTASPMRPVTVRYEFTFNGETHNYPSAVKSVPGAETGQGGRQRDNEMTGRGGLLLAGTAGYHVGNLMLPGYPLPWEIEYGPPPKGLELPRQILIGASNGASDYQNKVGEPLIQGTTRSFDMMIQDQWYGYRKCIVFVAGIGQIRREHVQKEEPKAGQLMVRFGGDSREVGVGGGSRSSDILKQDQTEQAYDQSGVQRGDAIMGNLIASVTRDCSELGIRNPVKLGHDSGAGGMSNVVPEAAYPAGAYVILSRIPMGDTAMSQRVYWTNESQEINIVLVEPDELEIFIKICSRENCPVQVIGFITGNGKFTLFDERDGSIPVMFDMKDLLGEDVKVEPKELTSVDLKGSPFVLPRNLTVREALDRVLRLIDVGSKRFLTTKADRSVSGLVAQQQTVGPCQLTLADFAIVANSMLQKTGAAISIGEQPIYGLINPGAMVRMGTTEALLNLAGAGITSYDDIFFCGNWMWAVKLPGEGVRLYNAVEAVTKFLKKMGLGINTGKDSLSMACETAIGEIIKAIISPGTFIASAYTMIADITKKATPDFKRPGYSQIMFLDLGKGKARMGGSVLGRVFNVLGRTAPDMKDHRLLKNAFCFVQELLDRDLIMAYHDRSDGGAVVTLSEMAFAGNCGLTANFTTSHNHALAHINTLFTQEAGYAFECMPNDEREIEKLASGFGLSPFLHRVGKTTKAKQISVSVNQENVLREDMRVLRDIWEATSFELDKLQANPETVIEEKRNIYDRPGMHFQVNFTPRPTPARVLRAPIKPRVAIFGDRGSNSRNEMTNSWELAGWDPWDVRIDDLKKGKVSLEIFRAVAGIGGFSNADVPDAGKGSASVITFNHRVHDEFTTFLARPDTIGLWICNFCQVAPYIGVVPWENIPLRDQPRFIWGRSHRFESRFVTVKILPNNSIFLKGMEDSVLGVWGANGEGKLHFPNQAIKQRVLNEGLSPIRFTDDDMKITVQYPFNMSGGAEGMCSLSSRDGRHLAFMLHPERTSIIWEWAYTPWGWRQRKISPWLMLFQNTYAHAMKTEDLSEKPPRLLLAA